MIPDIYVVLIHHKHGENIILAETELTARRKVAEYCKSWWALDLNEELQGIPIPEDDERAIEVYFKLMEDESYTIDLVSVYPAGEGE